MLGTGFAVQVPEMSGAVAYRRLPEGVELLLVRSGGGKWTFPKGRSEPGESHRAAAAREALEEAGAIGAMAYSPLTTYRMAKSLGRGLRVTVSVTAFLLDVREPARACEPHRNPTWFRPDEARRALALGRSPGEAAELARVLDAAVRVVEGSR